MSAMAPHQTVAASIVNELIFCPMSENDLTEIVFIEEALYDFPWTLGNFKDSLASGYQCWVARSITPVPTLIGYFLMMLSPDESHLLNITVAQSSQGQGVGRKLIDHAITLARTNQVPAMLLEVRPSNTKALSVYHHLGFEQIGLRKRYYPAADNLREDAIVMRLSL